MARRSFVKSGKGELFGRELPSFRAELQLGMRPGGHDSLKALGLQARSYYGVILGVEARIADRDPKLAFVILGNQKWCDGLFRHQQSLCCEMIFSAKHDPIQNAQEHARSRRERQAADTNASAVHS